MNRKIIYISILTLLLVSGCSLKEPKYKTTKINYIICCSSINSKFVKKVEAGVLYENVIKPNGKKYLHDNETILWECETVVKELPFRTELKWKCEIYNTDKLLEKNFVKAIIIVNGHLVKEKTLNNGSIDYIIPNTYLFKSVFYTFVVIPFLLVRQSLQYFYTLIYNLL